MSSKTRYQGTTAEFTVVLKLNQGTLRLVTSDEKV
jgi:hypothetical protein